MAQTIKKIEEPLSSPWIEEPGRLYSMGSQRAQYDRVTSLSLSLAKLNYHSNPAGAPGFSVHGIFQARVLEWVAISFPRGSSWPRGWTEVSRIVGRRFILWAIREAQTSPDCPIETFSGVLAIYYFLMPNIYTTFLPDPGIQPGSPALQVDSLPTELYRKPHKNPMMQILLYFFLFCYYWYRNWDFGMLSNWLKIT